MSLRNLDVSPFAMALIHVLTDIPVRRIDSEWISSLKILLQPTSHQMCLMSSNEHCRERYRSPPKLHVMIALNDVTNHCNGVLHLYY